MVGTAERCGPAQDRVLAVTAGGLGQSIPRDNSRPGRRRGCTAYGTAHPVVAVKLPRTGPAVLALLVSAWPNIVSPRCVGERERTAQRGRETIGPDSVRIVDDGELAIGVVGKQEC